METPLPPPWGDISRLSNKSMYVDRQSWVAKFGPLNLILTRHADYADGEWEASCLGVLSHEMIVADSLGDAANQAEAILVAALEAIISNMEKP